MGIFDRLTNLTTILATVGILSVLSGSAKGLESSASYEADNPMSWVAFGDLRGYLEPCGCDPRTDMGGIRRISAYLKRERALNRGTLLFSLGNNYSPMRDGSLSTANLKAPFFEEAIAELRPTATLANVTELVWARENPNGKFEKMSQFQVLSNSTKEFEARRLAVPFVLSGDTIVLGYVWNESVKTLVEPFTIALAKKWQKIIDAKVSKRKRSVVLLFSGSDQELAKIVKAKIFDLIISSNRAPLEQEPGVEEREHPGKLIRSPAMFKFLMVPLGGQGVLLGGSARMNEAKPLAEIFGSDNSPLGNKSSSKTPEAKIGSIAGPSYVTWLDSIQEGVGHFDGLFSRYRDATGAQFDARSKQRLVDLAVSPFAGAEACKTCHSTAYDVWNKSKHAFAYKTLQLKSAHTDMECVSCHVVGANDIGGFVSLDASPGFAGVQCENCHGPRKEHASNPSIKPHEDSKNSCVSCHKTPHSSSFKFEDYWPKIKHGK